eukprot:1141157-Pelagomonas_calceolata.AAC.7
MSMTPAQGWHITVENAPTGCSGTKHPPIPMLQCCQTAKARDAGPHFEQVPSTGAAMPSSMGKGCRNVLKARPQRTRCAAPCPLRW